METKMSRFLVSTFTILILLAAREGRPAELQAPETVPFANGKMKTASGTAKVVDRTGNAKLKVTFFWPFYGDYWILDLDPDYTFAVVGEQDRKYLWILSRTPEIDSNLYNKILERITRQGYNTTKLIRTPHGVSSNG
jgi:apolipoprotein D and lipocalin family protein